MPPSALGCLSWRLQIAATAGKNDCMKTNPVRAKWKRGECCIGPWLTLASTTAAHLMAQVGFDWLTVELEHAPSTFETAANCYPIITAGNCVPLTRVPINSTENIKRVLDTGSWG